mmetsp:Transcript_74973/g.165869  ORF Transcript_74973/g.165869 Transcript_74973/m.165869 type:complete len:264 (-) Transcript_74973:54-845(-)
MLIAKVEDGILLELDKRLPSLSFLREALLHRLVLPGIRKVAFHAHLEDQQVGGQHFMEVGLSELLGGRLAIERIGSLKQGDGLLDDQPLEHRNHHHSVTEGKTSPRLASFQESLHERRCLVLQDAHLVHLRNIALHAVWLQALDEPAMLLGEVVVHHVAHTPRCKPTHGILRERLEGLPHARLDLRDALADHAVTTTHGRFQRGLEIGLQLLGHDCTVRECLAIGDNRTTKGSAAEEHKVEEHKGGNAALGSSGEGHRCFCFK